jgi:hypothetical protein
MAETSFERLGTPTAGRATVNKVGDGWGIEASHAVAVDPVLHLPLHDPRIPAPLPEPPPAPAPTEAEHRAALVEAKAAQQRADAALAKAVEAHGRALALVETCKQTLAGYASQDFDRLAATLTSLRDDDGGLTLPALDDRLIRRETAKLDLEDAEAAAETLLHELTLAREQADAAARRVNMAVMSVLSIAVADRIADQHADLLRQAAALMDTLLAFDRFSAGSGVRLSGKVSTLVLSQGTALLARLRDTSSWRAAAEKLLADPMAEISADDIATAPSKPYVVDNTVAPPLEMREEDRRALLASLPSQRKSA